MDIRKIISSMMQTYAWLHPGLATEPSAGKLRWEMNERTLVDLAKSPHSINALVFLPDPRFFNIPIEVISTEVMEHGEVSLVIKVM